MAAPPYKVKAVYEYKSPHEDDLSFPNGQIITVTEEEGEDWYVGEYIDTDGAQQDGLFPKNFVERYEPAAPPRPTRQRTKKEAAPPLDAPPLATEDVPVEAPQPVEPEQPISERVEPQKDMKAAAAALPAPEPVEPALEPATAPSPAPAPATTPAPGLSRPASSAKAPPPVSEKPSSFKDRIAAFNKGSAAPVAPVKPGPMGAGGSSTFIKKPFVAPPPARDSYVPPPRDPAPQKVYVRKEDPEISERLKQDQEDAEKAGLVSGDTPEVGEEAPKSTSLKDRIAALQKQQQEQAARRTEVTHKEKPKRPEKPRTDSEGSITRAVLASMAVVEDTGPEEVIQHEPEMRQSLETPQELPRPPPAVRRPSKQKMESPTDGNEADQSGAGDTTEDGGADSTEVEDNEGTARGAIPPPPRTSTTLSREIEHEAPSVADERDNEQGENDEEEEDVDEETRRKEELRARMAKMSGGMGMPGMFAMPSAPLPPRKRASGTSHEAHSEAPSLPSSPPQRMPMVPIPGLPHGTHREAETTSPVVTKEPEGGLPLSEEKDPEDVVDVEDVIPSSPAPKPTDRAAPPIPQDRPLPPPPPGQARAIPPPPGGRPAPPPPSREAKAPMTVSTEAGDPSTLSSPPAPPAGPRSPPAVPMRDSPILEPTSPTSPSDKRSSRTIPPIPTMLPAPTTESRPPPPPPPTAAPPTRESTEVAESEDEEGESEYEGDYDTDIAPTASHKNALNTVQDRDPSMDDSPLSEAGRTPAAAPPPVPTHRAVPPPPPHQAPVSRPSMDSPRAPPPAPPPREAPRDEDYDPYRYTGPTHGAPPAMPKARGGTLQQSSDPGLYSDMPMRSAPAVLDEPAGPAVMPGPVPRQSGEAPRESLDAPRQPTLAARQSMEQSRSSLDQGYIARDIDLGQNSGWWTQSRAAPPIFQGRADVLIDFDETTTPRRGGRTTVSRDVYVLFPDYSQSIITARFDPKEPTDATLEQRHEPPPARLRQDQLEQVHSKLGQAAFEAAAKRNNHTIGDGTPQALVLDILSTLPSALLPVGTRAYGALIYANMANATVQQLDEIRPGDIISFRNARFSGKHGAMHAKYSEDVGKPEHVGVVAEWDGTKKKVRAFEQGRDGSSGSKKGRGKVEVQSCRLADLRSGEVKVWRVVEKGWVGWD